MDDDGGAGRLLGGLDRYSRYRDRPQISHRAASLLTALHDALQPYVTIAHVHDVMRCYHELAQRCKVADIVCIFNSHQAHGETLLGYCFLQARRFFVDYARTTSF